jgi:hypothetical protein
MELERNDEHVNAKTNTDDKKMTRTDYKMTDIEDKKI